MSNARNLRTGRLTLGRYRPTDRSIPTEYDASDDEELHDPWEADEEYFSKPKGVVFLCGEDDDFEHEMDELREQDHQDMLTSLVPHN